MKTIKRSLIRKYFNEEIFLKIRSICMISNADNNIKGNMVKDLLSEYNIPFEHLGQGTNRLGVQIDGYAVKIALDADGQIDNQREMLYAKQLQPYVVKVYECTNGGDIAVFEYVEIFTKMDLYDSDYVSQMEHILEDITSNFLVGDAGITEKNYVNWGKRFDGSICILDFAYIYDVKYNLFSCPKCGPETVLRYDKKFVDLVCPCCGEKYTFGKIRRKITREEQRNEIGDIRRVGYCMTLAEQEFDMISDFEPSMKKKQKKVKDPNDISYAIKQHRKQKKDQQDSSSDFDYWDRD